MKKTISNFSGVLGENEFEDRHVTEELGSQEADIDDFSKADELSGSPGSDDDKQGLMHTVLEANEKDIDLGNMVMSSVNNGASLFTPELMMEKMVSDYRKAEEIFGPSLIRRLAGYDPSYVEKNMNIPEFRRELEKQIKENFADMQKEGWLSRDGQWTEKALDLATIVLAVSELDHLSALGMLGRRVHKKRNVDGTREEVRPFNNDTYRAINVQQSVKTAIRRGHKQLRSEDLRVHEKEAKGKLSVVYAIDVSGSMKGEKLSQAKRAGVALSYKAISQGDNAGLMIFEKDIKSRVLPGKDFSRILEEIATLRPGSETDLAHAIKSSVEIFSGPADTKHLLLLTDALPTIGEDPGKEVLSAVSEARAAGITISVIGIALDEQGEELAREIAELGDGRLSVVRDLSELDVLVLEEYDKLS